MTDLSAFSEYVDNAVRLLLARRAEREAHLNAKIAELNEQKVSDLIVFDCNIKQLRELDKIPQKVKQLTEDNQRLEKEMAENTKKINTLFQGDI